MSPDIEHARNLITRASSIVVLTGAGVSAESGVPTFRGPGGLWKSHRPEELATPEAFARDPRLVWEWYAWRRSLVADCTPNPAHECLARLALDRESTRLVTQNVDGLHHRAADSVASDHEDSSRAYPLEVHGAIHRDRCSGCDQRTPGRNDIDASSMDSLPRCENCQSLLRPDVVWFGEALDSTIINDSFEAARSADLCLVIGTSAVVYPAASVPEITLDSGGAVIEVNPQETHLSPRSSVSLRGPAGELVPDILKR